MAINYDSLKVTELREELKRRNIPTTKLSRKQDIIDRLVEDDNFKEAEGTETVDAAPEALNGNVQGQEAVNGGEDSTTQAEVAETAPEGTAGTEATNGDDHDIVDNGDKQESRTEADLAEVSAEKPSEGPVSEQSVQPPVDAVPTEDSSDPIPLPSKEPVEEQPTIVTTPPDDSKKRKRRSATPPVSRDSISKKLKETNDDVARVEEVMRDAPVPVEPVKANDESTARVLPMASSDDVMNISSQNDTVMNDTEPARSMTRRTSSPRQVRGSPNDRRYKDLLQPAADAPTIPQPLEDAEMEPSISPAIHHATSALYVRNLIRPINPAGLREHLIQLATPPTSSTTPSDPIQNFHVDALRTHALVHFSTVTTASRVRNALHNRVWPPEPTRKALWIDFIPSDKVDEWISLEISTSGNRPSQAKRWEVVYRTTDDGDGESDGQAVAELVEASATTTALAPPLGPRGADASASTPTQPSFPRRRTPPLSSDHKARSPPRAQEPPPQTAELDSLFPSTTSKPKLYYLPVSASLADRRLDELTRLTSRDWDAVRDKERNRGDYLGRGLDSLRRFTFEDGDVLVDGGAEFGWGGFRGGRGRPRGR
ncbi:hypothetical protein MBLNU457_4789t1 [Dothideomycetes sp. NU457]